MRGAGGGCPCLASSLTNLKDHPLLTSPLLVSAMPDRRFVLFFVTMKRQILHMIKHRYVPFSFGKKVGGR